GSLTAIRRLPRHDWAKESDGIFLRRRLADQGEEGLESGSVGVGRVKLESGGKHSRLMEASKA
ncbi:MAG: hypothetical protein ACK5N0_15370, partial [Synechococcaceae cyanobacterium]